MGGKGHVQFSTCSRTQEVSPVHCYCCLSLCLQVVTCHSMYHWRISKLIGAQLSHVNQRFPRNRVISVVTSSLHISASLRFFDPQQSNACPSEDTLNGRLNLDGALDSFAELAVYHLGGVHSMIRCDMTVYSLFLCKAKIFQVS
jgi:hypothetical protein